MRGVKQRFELRIEIVECGRLREVGQRQPVRRCAGETVVLVSVIVADVLESTRLAGSIDIYAAIAEVFHKGVQCLGQLVLLSARSSTAPFYRRVSGAMARPGHSAGNTAGKLLVSGLVCDVPIVCIQTNREQAALSCLPRRKADDMVCAAHGDKMQEESQAPQNDGQQQTVQGQPQVSGNGTA